MSRGALQKLQRRSRYEKRTNVVFCTSSKKASESRSSRFETKMLSISFSRGSGSLLIAIGTANPTWGDIFECCVKAQSSKLEHLFSLKCCKRYGRGLNFELSKMPPHVGLAVPNYLWRRVVVFTRGRRNIFSRHQRLNLPTSRRSWRTHRNPPHTLQQDSIFN